MIGKLVYRKGSAHDPKHTIESVKRGGGDMGWVCLTDNGTGAFVFIEDVTADKSNIWAILSAHIQPDASRLRGWHFQFPRWTVTRDTAKATKDIFEANKCNMNI